MSFRVKIMVKNRIPDKSDANIKIFCPETHKNIHVDNDQVEVTLSNDEKIYSKLLVGADGARSSIREQFSFGVKSKQYDQSCLVANASVVNNCYESVLKILFHISAFYIDTKLSIQCYPDKL